MMETATTTGTGSTYFDGGIFLPEQVIFQILLWLPVISILRFKSVCKSWCTLIQSSTFIDQHLHLQHHCPISKDNNTNLLVMDLHHSVGDNLCFFLLSGNEYELSVDLDLPGFSNGKFLFIKMVTCNGLVCLFDYGKCYINDKWVYSNGVFLWNPATKQSRALPQSPFPPPPGDGDYPVVEIFIGFGFDVKTNDYKLVKLIQFSYYPRTEIDNHVEVYSLNTDSWRTIDAHMPVDMIQIISAPTKSFMNGTFCWLGSVGYARAVRDPVTLKRNKVIFNNCILSFDFSDEVFGTTPLPDVHTLNSNSHQQLAVLRDMIACVTNVFNSGFCEIWVLNEFGVQESWTKLYKVVPPFECIPKGILKNGQFLLFVMNRQLCIYDFVTQEVKNLPGQGSLLNIGDSQVAEYKESLVSVKRGNDASNRVTYAEGLGSGCSCMI